MSKKKAVFRFGKYKGRTIREITETDPDYIIWAHRNIGGLFGEKELEHLNSVWRRLHGHDAVVTYRSACAMPYTGTLPGLAGKRLGELRTRELTALAKAEPAWKEPVEKIVWERRWHRTMREYIHSRTSKPVFQTDYI